jgi:hypothetical protein
LIKILCFINCNTFYASSHTQSAFDLVDDSQSPEVLGANIEEEGVPVEE